MFRPTSSSARLLGPVLVAVVCLVPVLLWAGAAPLDQRFATASATLTGVGVVCGLVGLSTFSTNLFLGGRFWFVEALFGGLDSMYRTHRILGRVAFLLLLAHAVLVLGGQVVLSGWGTLRVLLPTNSWTVPLGVLALVVMGVTLVITLYVRVGHELFIYVHRFFGIAFGLGALHAFLTPGTKSLSDALTAYLVVLAALGFGGWVYRSLFGDAMVRRRYYEVTRIERFGDALEISMVSGEGPLQHLPGQFIFLTFRSESLSKEFHPFDHVAEGGGEVVSFRAGAVRNQFHPFSITSPPGALALSVAIKASGDYTTALRHLREGDTARVEGPFGSFSHRNVRNARQVWISGGIGITPFLSMARSLDEAGPDIVLFYAVKRAEQAYFLRELEELAGRLPNFRVIPFPEPECGRPSAEAVARLCSDVDRRDIMICGPPIMIDVLRDQFAARGVPK
ncbi:MAG: ferredoxin reductase family protein, partial [Actinomycetota bacterium]